MSTQTGFQQCCFNFSNKWAHTRVIFNLVPFIWNGFKGFILQSGIQVHGPAFLAISTLQLQLLIIWSYHQARPFLGHKYNLHWVLHPRKHLKFFRGVLFLGSGPLNSWLLADRAPDAFEEGHSTRPVGGISKNLTLYCSSASGLQSQHPLSRLTSILVVP